jgi:luciferase family oxidoreductase group 1
MRLSVLDQSTTTAGRSPDTAIRESLKLARACEALGYHRYWVSEHHNNSAIAGSAPEVLLGALAAVTKVIRIGSAGVLLPHYSPFKVAEQFRVLEALAPGRIDLGIGRGPGADRQTVYALNPAAMDNLLSMAGADTFASDVEDLIAWSLGEALPEDHQFAGVRAQPLGPTAPQPWIVGSTSYTAGLAAHLGLPYCFAHFFHDGADCAEVLDVYRKNFKPSRHCANPLVGLCVWAMAATTKEKAEQLFLPYAHWRLDRDHMVNTPFPGATQVAARAPTAKAAARIARLRDATICGTPDTVAKQLVTLAEAFAVDEMVIVTMTHDPADRLRSYELIADQLGLVSSREVSLGSAEQRLAIVQ